MSSDAIQEGLDLVRRSLSAAAFHRVVFSRDETDSYQLLIDANKGVSPALSRNEISGLLPSGSKWLPACGWRSFFGAPFGIRGQEWLMIGVEAVVPHSGRGAYPVLHGYCFPFQQFPEGALLEIAQTVAGRAADCLGAETYGVIESNSREPQDHVGIEGWIIRQAVQAYRARKRLLFRTVILSEGEVPSSHRFRSSLVATVPSIRRTLSLSARTKLFLSRRISITSPPNG